MTAPPTAQVRDGHAPALDAGPHRWAVVDVETSGLYANRDRVLSVAVLALDESGRIEGQLVSLVDAGCDPGPVHIHGLTRQRLTGAPRFAQVLPPLRDLLDGRVLVAHNAAFDHGFLSAEAARAGRALPTKQRLCTLTLSRRLGVDVPNHKLNTLANHWGVRHRNAHDSLDDALALVGVFAHSVHLARRLQLSLPVLATDAHPEREPYPARVVKTPCLWRWPGELRPGFPLVQGMKAVVTGDTQLPREELVGRLVAAGLDVTGSVSRVTNLLVCNDHRLQTEKALSARAHGTLVLDEAAVLALLHEVLPGAPKAMEPVAPRARHQLTRPLSTGPLVGRRVLVLGGTHADAAAFRADVTAQGAAAAVNLSASVTDVIVLDGGDNDFRVRRAEACGIGVHRGPAALGIVFPGTPPSVVAPVTLKAPLQPLAAPITASAASAVMHHVDVLPRGGVVDLPPGEVWTVNVAWRADALADGAELDVVAFIVDEDERVVADEDFVFYNAPVSEDGAVYLSVDGDSEQSIRIDLRLLPEHCRRIVVAAALTGGRTFGDIGAVSVSLDDEDSTLFTSTLDAGTSERTMLIGEVYLRRDGWRFRSLGQGYDSGLDSLVVRYGVALV